MKSEKIHHPPKILFVTYEFHDKVFGGIGRVINGLSEALENKIEFDVFLLEWNNLSMVFSGTLFHGGKKKEKFWRSQHKVIHYLIKKKKYDIVHFLHCGAEAYVSIKYLREKNTCSQIVYSCHSLAKHEQNIRKNSEKEIFYEEYILQNVDHIHVLNQSSKKWLLEQYKQTVQNKSIHVIANGINIVDYQTFSPEFLDKWKPLIEKDKNLVVLCMSRWSHGKGIEHLLKALPIVAQQIPNIKVIIVGRKQNSWENKVEDYVKSIDDQITQLSPLVIPMGWVNDIERNTLLNVADICVMPSEMEYFPYSILEPMASKLPIISSELSCVEEMLEKDIEGLFFPTARINELAKQLIKLALDPQLRLSMSDNSYKKVKQKYSWEVIANQYIKYYRDILSNQLIFNNHAEILFN